MAATVVPVPGAGGSRGAGDAPERGRRGARELTRQQASTPGGAPAAGRASALIFHESLWSPRAHPLFPKSFIPE